MLEIFLIKIKDEINKFKHIFSDVAPTLVPKTFPSLNKITVGTPHRKFDWLVRLLLDVIVKTFDFI